MTLAPAKIPSLIFEEFSRRAVELGALSWWVDAEENIAAHPRLEGSAGQWVQSNRLRAAIEAAVQSQSSAEIFSGCRLVVFPDHAGSIVSMILSADAFSQPEFARICRQGDVDEEAAADDLHEYIQNGSNEEARVLASLKHYHADLSDAAESQKLTDVFSQRLSQSYEEANLLFRMSRFLNSVGDPPAVVSLLCNQMVQILPFQWMAIWFSGKKEVVGSLAGKLTFAGSLPCPQNQFISLVQNLTQNSSVDDWTRVLVPDQSELAAISGAEILAEPIAHNGRCVGILLAGNKQGDDPDISSEDIQFLDATSDFLGVFHENMARFADQRNLFLGTLRALAFSIDAKDPYTQGHSDRVALLAGKLAAAMGLTESEVEQFHIAGQLHDVGKIGVPEAVLCKPGKLTDEEFNLIKKHPEIGHKILRDIPGLESILPGVLHHHERWDGCGYPHKLANEQIPLIARVLALADTFDAMSSNRSYRNALTRDHVLGEIAKSAGRQFNPELAAMFVKMDFSDFDQMLQRNAQ